MTGTWLVQAAEEEEQRHERPEHQGIGQCARQREEDRDSRVYPLQVTPPEMASPRPPWGGPNSLPVQLGRLRLGDGTHLMASHSVGQLQAAGLTFPSRALLSSRGC